MTGCKAQCRISWRLFLCKKTIWKISFVIRRTSAHQAEEKLVIVFFRSLFWMFCWNFRWFFCIRGAYKWSVGLWINRSAGHFGISIFWYHLFKHRFQIASFDRCNSFFFFHSATFVRRTIFRRCDRFLLLPHIFYSVAVATINNLNM